MNEGLVAAVVESDNVLQTELSATKSEPNKSINYLPPDFALIGSLDSEPTSLDKALRGPDATKWQTALEYEISQLEKLETWVVEDLPKGHTLIPCSEVLKVKQGPNGEIQSYRVQIVAGGHRQVEGVNYSETFSAAAKMPTVCAVLANAAEQDWEIEHVDVKSAYLNAPLKETMYMKALRGVLKPGQDGKVLRLLKGLYGLNQARRGWYLEMSRIFIKELGFVRSAADHSVFHRRTVNDHTVIVVATDNMAVTSKQAVDAIKFKAGIRKFWEITDNGPISWFLGFRIKRDWKAKTLSINQQAYIEGLAEKFRLTNAKPVTTLMDTNAQYSIEQCPTTPNQLARMTGVPFSEAIGSVLWPAVVSQPDIVFGVGVLSQFVQNPGPIHWEALKRVIVYLNTTKGSGLLLRVILKP